MTFYNTEARLAHLRQLLACGDRRAFEKQAWEWIKIGVFGLQEFREILRMGRPVQNVTVQQIDCPLCGLQKGLQ